MRRAAGALLLAALAVAATPRAAAQNGPAAPSYVETLGRAYEKTRAREWKEAAALWERVVRENPVQPFYWSALGDARYYAGDYKGAVPAYEKAVELGAPIMGPSFAAYQIACCHALAGEKELAMRWLERALAMGFPSLEHAKRDEDLKSLRDDPRFRRLLGLEDVSRMSRDEGWRYDLSVLAGEVRRKGFGVHRPVTREQFDAKARELHDAIPRLDDRQVILALMRLMVFLGDGHTSVWDVGENPFFAEALPVQFYWFEEGLFVIAADPKYRELLGAEVLAVDGRPVGEALEALTPYVSRDRGNAVWPKQKLPYMLRRAALLEAVGIAKSPDRVTLTVRDAAGATREAAVEADATHPNIWNVLPNPPSWERFASALPEMPLYLRSMDRPYWFEYLPEKKTVYFQLNSIRNDEKEPMAAFVERLLKFVDENDVEKLAIDMRWNNGGDTSVSQPLVLGLVGNRKINQRGKLFVIVGRRTYSAAQNTASYIERYTNATFVGEPTGSSPNFVGEEDPVTLPYSRLMANVSHLAWQGSWPQDQRMWLAPHIYTPPTWADFRAGRDAALEAVLAFPPL